jgi:hypothetical protein
MGVLKNSLKGVSDRSGKSWVTALENKVQKISEQVHSSLDCFQSVGKANLSVGPHESSRITRGNASVTPDTSMRDRSGFCGENQKVSDLKDIDEEFGKGNQGKKAGKAGAPGRASINMQGHLGQKGNEKKERESASVDGMLRRSVVEMKTDNGKNQGKGKYSEANSISQSSKEGNQGGLNIAEALGELKNRIARVLTKRTEIDLEKINVIYQALCKSRVGEVA